MTSMYTIKYGFVDFGLTTDFFLAPDVFLAYDTYDF